MENIEYIFTDKIKLPPNNMREHIDRDELFELAEDIKKNGLLSPIIVRPSSDAFELVAGQRRYLAHQIAGILKIKCIVRNLTDDEALSIMTSENLARAEVNPVDEANHVTRLLSANENDIKKVMHIVSRGEKWVKDRLAIGAMPAYMQELLAKKELKIGVALILVQITDESIREMWTFQAVRDGVSVAMAEYWLADFKRQLMPGGSLAGKKPGEIDYTPPQAVLLRCAIDGKEYDVKDFKSLMVHKDNMLYFLEFAKAFRSAPPETQS